jgi:hypothetical protein
LLPPQISLRCVERKGWKLPAMPSGKWNCTVRFLFSSSYPSRSPRSSLFPTRASWEEENLARVPPCRPIPAASGSLRRPPAMHRPESTALDPTPHTNTSNPPPPPTVGPSRRRLQPSGRRAAASKKAVGRRLEVYWAAPPASPFLSHLPISFLLPPVPSSCTGFSLFFSDFCCSLFLAICYWCIAMVNLYGMHQWLLFMIYGSFPPPECGLDFACKVFAKMLVRRCVLVICRWSCDAIFSGIVDHDSVAYYPK